MSTRAAAWLAWSVWTLCVALVMLTGLLSYLTPDLALPLLQRVPLQAMGRLWREATGCSRLLVRSRRCSRWRTRRSAA